MGRNSRRNHAPQVRARTRPDVDQAEQLVPCTRCGSPAGGVPWQENGGPEEVLCMPCVDRAQAAQQLALNRTSRPAVPAVPRGNSRWDALAGLAATVEQVRSLEARRDRQVMVARGQKATWTEIASALGVTPQAVQQRYGKRAHTPADGR